MSRGIGAKLYVAKLKVHSHTKATQKITQKYV